MTRTRTTSTSRRGLFALALIWAAATTACGSTAHNDVDAADDVEVAPSVTVDTDHALRGEGFEVRLPGSVTNHTNRSNADINALVINAMLTVFATRPDIDTDQGLDPTTTPGAFRIAASVSAISYVYQGSGSYSISTTVQFVIFRYSNNALLGAISKTVTGIGTSAPDHAVEDTIITAGAKTATKSFIAAFCPPP